MRASFRNLLLATLVSLNSPSGAEEPGTVLACDTLVNLRILLGGGDRSAAQATLPRHPGCRLIPRDRIGTAEHRAMVGGAPYECLFVTGEPACAWIAP